jgi:hypothetical protein
VTTTTAEPTALPPELEPDNATRLAIFDAMWDAAADGDAWLTIDQLSERVMGRLRVLVPRELHNLGERPYLEEKLAVCVEGDVLTRASDDRYAIAPDPQVWIRYPDDSVRRYTPGLIKARERLEAVNSALRDRRFDVTRHVPHDKPSSPEFKALVRSMEEHGFLKQFAIYRFPDETFVDGVARIAAANAVGIEPKWLELKKQDPETTRMRRRDTPLNRVLLALDSNITRLTQEQRQHVLDAAADAAGRTWEQINEDLSLTRRWRGVTARSYTPMFEVREIPFDEDDARKIQVTDDHKVHVTSLLRASGLAKHKFDTELKDRVFSEMARVRGGGPAAVFVQVADMVEGLEAMIAERRAHQRKVSAEWEVSLDWLRDYARKHGIGHSGG